MSLPLIETLPKSVARALPIIEGGVSRGLSSRAINAIIKETFGTGLRRVNLLDTMRAFTGIQRANDTLKFTRKDRIPTIRKLPEAITRIKRNFSFTFEAKGRLIDTDLAITQNITIATDRPLSVGAMEAMVVDIIEAGVDRYKIVVDKIVLTGGLQAGAAGTL